MKILNAKVENFSSYQFLEFAYRERGLILVQGPNGSGKSTLCDVVPWILFSVTAKNGAVDEVLSWTTNAPTKGEITLEVNNGRITIRRVRSRTTGNDLSFTTDGGTDVRGATVTDTQRLINDLLGMDSDTYLASAYFHEFSQTASFFVANTKIRRNICEQIVDLSLPRELQRKASDRLKEVKANIAKCYNDIQVTTARTDFARKELDRNVLNTGMWDRQQQKKIAELQHASDSFESTQQDRVSDLSKRAQAFEISRNKDIELHLARIKPAEFFRKETAELKVLLTELKSAVCRQCGGPSNSTQVLEIQSDIQRLKSEEQDSLRSEQAVKTLSKAQNPYTEQLEATRTQENTYALRIAALEKEANPYKKDQKRLAEQIARDVTSLEDQAKAEAKLKTEKLDLETLQDTVTTFRSVLMETAISALETQTNALLSKFFDAELSVDFELTDSDKLEVEILKDGNRCTFSQLSKGQRQLLKLCFGVSVMQYVKKYNQLQISALFFDEALDSLDDIVRMKTFRLFESLAIEYDSVFVVDHSEALKAMFNSRCDVALVNGNSVLTEAL